MLENINRSTNQMTYSAGKYLSLLITLTISISLSCTNQQDQNAEVITSELPELELVHQFSITDTEDLILQQISGINTDSEGRIFLTDIRALQVHVFDADGDYISSIGRAGSGPGEFLHLVRAFVDPNDRLFVHDVRQARTTIFIENNNSWEPDQIFTIEGQRYGIDGADIDGNVILRQSRQQYPGEGAFWYEHELAAGNLSEGLIKPNVLTIKDMGFLSSGDGALQRIPFGRTTVVSTDPDGNLYLVWNEQFEMAKYNAKMEFIDSLSVNIPNQPVSTEENRNALDRVGPNFRALAREHMPDSKPVIINMLVDKSGNFWLQTFDTPKYLILAPDGAPLKSFDLEDGLQLLHIDEKRIYTLEQLDEGYRIQIFDYQL
jgi:hypothetical protein